MNTSKTVAIVQSNYIPWRGYFDLINSADEFILYDDAQYTIRDWRNRNLIKTADGPRWLTIPVKVKGKYLQKIKETVISDPSWGLQHWASLTHSYSKAAFFSEYESLCRIVPRNAGRISFANQFSFPCRDLPATGHHNENILVNGPQARG